MKITKKIIIILLISISPLFAAYNKEAKNNLSNNDIYSFVYAWFANFDHQNDISVFTQHLDDKNISIQYPDHKLIKSVADFKDWYKGVERYITYNYHDIKEVNVKKIDNHNFEVNLLVNWKGKNFFGKNLNLNIAQKWLVQEKDKKLYLISLQSTKK